MNARRGNESERHIKAKLAIGHLFEGNDWSVFFEQCNTDILVMHHATRFVAAIEAESSPRNVLRNISRNIAHGCKAVAVVSINDRYREQICAKVRRYTDPCDPFPIRIFPYDEQGLSELHRWITSLATGPITEDQS